MVEPLELVPALTSDPLGATVSMDLDDFNAIALNLAGGHAADHDGPLGDPATFPPQESQRRFVSFVLTGKNPDTGEQTVIDLDCYRANNEMHEDTRLEIRGDFDSCLFASDNLPYAHPLMLLIWPPKYLVDHSLKQTYLMIGGPHGKVSDYILQIHFSLSPGLRCARCNTENRLTTLSGLVQHRAFARSAASVLHRKWLQGQPCSRARCNTEFFFPPHSTRCNTEFLLSAGSCNHLWARWYCLLHFLVLESTLRAAVGARPRIPGLTAERIVAHHHLFSSQDVLRCAISQIFHLRHAHRGIL